MKRTSKLLAVVATMAIGTSAMAASSGSLLLQGTVALVNTIVVTANAANNTSLNITTGETGKNVASVAETSNDLNGYTITVSSPTGGFLVNTANAAAKTAYKVSYNGATAVTPTVAALQVKSVASLSGLTTNTSAVTVDVTGLSTAAAGTYQDTLTIAIVAN